MPMARALDISTDVATLTGVAKTTRGAESGSTLTSPATGPTNFERTPLLHLTEGQERTIAGDSRRSRNRRRR